MLKTQQHIIQKVFLEVETNSAETAYDLKDNIEGFLNEKVFPIIEQYFEALGISFQETLQIQKLELNLFANNVDAIEDILPQITSQLKTVFESNNKLLNIKKSGFKKLKVKENDVNALIYFLKNGKLPWWIDTSINSKITIDSLLYNSFSETAFQTKLQKELQNPSIRKRAILQLSDFYLGLLLNNQKALKVSLSFTKEKEFQTLISKIPKQMRNWFWNYLICVSFEENHKNAVIELKSLFLQTEKIDRKTVKQVQNIATILKENNLIETEDNNEINELLFAKKKIVSAKEYKKIKSGSFINNAESKEKDTTKLDNNSAIGKKGFTDLVEEKDAITTSKLSEKNINQKVEENKQNEKLNFDVKSETNIDANKQALQNLESDNAVDLFEDKIEEDSLQKGVHYVENAGLILLHPFLKSFFKNCGLLNESNTINDKTLAVHLLHFLATGKEGQFEHLQLFEKFLCGVPINHSISREVKISKELKAKSTELLTAVLSHLPQLKSSSIDLLRNEFLQRPGKLILKENKVKLIIEQKTVDILLKNIAWNISLIKLPWLKNMFTVDW